MDRTLASIKTDNEFTSLINNTTVGYSLFQNDNVFYTVLIVVVCIVVIFGILLIICMVYKPSFRSEEYLRRHPIEFSQHKKDKNSGRAEFTMTNRFNRKQVSVISTNNTGNQSLSTENSLGRANETISILDTRLPPLISQSSNNIKPREIEKLRNALEEVEHQRDVAGLAGGNRILQKELEPLDITSLTQVEDSF